MTTTIIGLIALVCIALVAWGVAELKNKHLPYQPTEIEKKAEEQAAQVAHDANNEEKGIKDVIETISTKGYDA